MGGQADISFQSLIRAITDQVKLFIPDPDKRLCLSTDASSTHRAGILTQVAVSHGIDNVALPQDWEHAPVTSVMGPFKGSSYCWSTPEQECYAIIAGVLRLSHILAVCPEFSMFTDPKNILYILSPTRFDKSVACYVVYKTQRWALRLTELNYTVEPI